jgi:hypothetical protein
MGDNFADFHPFIFRPFRPPIYASLDSFNLLVLQQLLDEAEVRKRTVKAANEKNSNKIKINQSNSTVQYGRREILLNFHQMLKIWEQR